MAMALTELQGRIPGYTSGTWVIDPVHSEVGFSVRHLMLSRVRGRFAKFEGRIVTSANPLESSVEATIELSSIDTNNSDRDAHLRSADFFDVERHPLMTYHSTAVRVVDRGFLVDGELSLHGITRPVTLVLQVEGFLPSSPFGDTRVGFSASAEINRSDFDIKFGIADSGGVGLGDRIQIALEVEAVMQPDA
jgi:polyisoprenoid-binding protein YceI